jgi:hypothetical protein
MEIKREGERKREKERERERERERCPELLSLFLKGMTGAWAPFSYLVLKYNHSQTCLTSHVS